MQVVDFTCSPQVAPIQSGHETLYVPQLDVLMRHGDDVYNPPVSLVQGTFKWLPRETAAVVNPLLNQNNAASALYVLYRYLLWRQVFSNYDTPPYGVSWHLPMGSAQDYLLNAPKSFSLTMNTVCTSMGCTYGDYDNLIATGELDLPEAFSILKLDSWKNATTCWDPVAKIRENALNSGFTLGPEAYPFSEYPYSELCPPGCPLHNLLALLGSAIPLLSGS